VSVGLGLLIRMVQDSSPMTLLGEHGISGDLFRGDEKPVFEYMNEHVIQFGRLPEVETIEAETGVVIQPFPDEPIGYWLDRFEQRHQSFMLSEANARVDELLREGQVAEARTAVRDVYLRLEERHPEERLHQLKDVADAVVVDHDELRRKGYIDGVPFGIEHLDYVSNGAQPGDTVALVGRPGMGKSYLLLSNANNAYNHGRIPLVVTLEMPVKQCVRRILALRSHVPATLIRIGKVGWLGRRVVGDALANIADGATHPFYFMQGTLTSTVDDLVLRIRETRPHIVYVDGAYMLRTSGRQESHWERVTSTAEYLKKIATEFMIPVIATYQFNRRGPGSLGNIALSDAVGQLASMVIGIEDEGEPDDPAELEGYKLLELLKGREGERGVIRIHYDMDRMNISQHSVVRGVGVGVTDYDF